MKDTKSIIAIPLAIVIAGGLISGAIFFTRGGTSGGVAAVGDSAAQPSQPIAPVSNADHIRGSADADVVIVEYSDTECPFCKNFHNSMNQIMSEYGRDGKVAWVYRHFPLSMHQYARKEAEATECAAELGGTDSFWQYLDMIFELTESNDGLDPAELPKIAEDIGLDRAEFTTCLDSGRHATTVEADYQDGLAAGVEGTPYSFVALKGSSTVVPINGAQPYTTVKQVIDTLLGQK